MTNTKLSLKRQRHPMPDYIRYALESRKLMLEYFSRPPYQQNDYIGWIQRGGHERTRHKRITQMLDELEAGGVYMKMAHTPSIKLCRK